MFFGVKRVVKESLDPKHGGFSSELQDTKTDRATQAAERDFRRRGAVSLASSITSHRIEDVYNEQQ